MFSSASEPAYIEMSLHFDQAGSVSRRCQFVRQNIDSGTFSPRPGLDHYVERGWTVRRLQVQMREVERLQAELAAIGIGRLCSKGPSAKDMRWYKAPTA